MKKFIILISIASITLTSCGGGSETPCEGSNCADSTARADTSVVDSTSVTPVVDTTATADTTSTK